MSVGRPSLYTDELVNTFIARLCTGESVRTICKSDDMPEASTIFKWLTEKPEFSEQYAKAKELAAEALAEDIFDIADDNAFDYTEGADGQLRVNNDAIQRARLRVDVRKWYLSKIMPKKYGEKLGIGGVEGAPPITTQDITSTKLFEMIKNIELKTRAG